MAVAQAWGVTAVAEFGWVPANRCMYWSRNSVYTVSVLTFQYLPGHRRKNNLIQARSEISCWRSEPPCEEASRVWRIDIGRARNIEVIIYSLFVGCKLSVQTIFDGYHSVE